MKPFLLKRFDEDIAVLSLSEEGHILDYKIVKKNEALAPLHDPKSTDWLRSWWSRRAVPISQGHIKSLLEKMGFSCSEEYLVKNLGLSLTDYYWICPAGSGLKWEQVNLFTNDFHDDINISGEEPDAMDEIPHYTPNGSLQGTLDKCWTIRNGKRVMIKGNRDALSAESFNEVIASRLHEMQGFRNFTKYKLTEIHGKPYRYGCFSELFTSLNQELISAHDVEISKKKRPDVNTYEHFIGICGEHGLGEDVLRPFLEYQIMTDFILSGRDRHLSNVSILRDANTLQFTQPAPIYDSGKSMFVAASVPKTEKEMLNIPTESFQSTERRLLAMVRDRSLVDANKLPSPTFVRELYGMDDHMDESRIEEIVRGYEMKVDLFTRWQAGEDLDRIANARRVFIQKPDLGDIFEK